MKTLTIAIPTYNRAIYLKRCLDSISKEIVNREDVEVIIYDNASIDNTFEVSTEFTSLNPNINYIKNDTNIGPDKNIGQSYYNSNSRYTLVFGDDDLFLTGSLCYILDILNRPNEYGLVFLNYYSFKENHLKEKPCINSNFVLSLGINDMIRISGFRLGFISACIVNTKSICKDQILANVGTNFNHLYPIVGSLKLGFENLYINKYIIAQQEANSGGFDYFKVFAINYTNVFRDILHNDKKIINILIKELTIKILPTAILFSRLHSSPTCYKVEPAKPTLSIYNNNSLYKIFDNPIFELPLSFARLYRIITVLVSKTYYKAQLLLIMAKSLLTKNK